MAGRPCCILRACLEFGISARKGRTWKGCSSFRRTRSLIISLWRGESDPDEILSNLYVNYKPTFNAHINPSARDHQQGADSWRPLTWAITALSHAPSHASSVTFYKLCRLLVLYRNRTSTARTLWGAWMPGERFWILDPDSGFGISHHFGSAEGFSKYYSDILVPVM